MLTKKCGYSIISQFIICFFLIRFTNIQDKAMLGMNIIPSIFVDHTSNMEVSKIVDEFKFFEDDLPIPETLEAELLQWRVRIFYNILYHII